jgi:hypothetical protein
LGDLVVDVDEICAAIWQLPQLLKAVSAVDDPGIDQ